MSAKRTAALITVGLCICLSASIKAIAAADENPRMPTIKVNPFTFIGTAADCPGLPAGSDIVTAAWLPGMGLPDDGSANTTDPANTDPHFGLLLSKNGPTQTCSAAGASITGVAGAAITELGFDIRNGTHCGGGAPRFNIITTDNVFHAASCGDSSASPAPQDPAHWMRIRVNLATQVFPPLPPNAAIQSISILYDEGTDQPSTQDPNGSGLAVIDNIDINGTLVTHGPTNATGATSSDNQN